MQTSVPKDASRQTILSKYTVLYNKQSAWQRQRAGDLPVVGVQVSKLLGHGRRQHFRGQVAVACPARCPALAAVPQQSLHQLPLEPAIVPDCALQGQGGRQTVRATPSVALSAPLPAGALLVKTLFLISSLNLRYFSLKPSALVLMQQVLLKTLSPSFFIGPFKY